MRVCQRSAGLSKGAIQLYIIQFPACCLKTVFSIVYRTPGKNKVFPVIDRAGGIGWKINANETDNANDGVVERAYSK